MPNVDADFKISLVIPIDQRATNLEKAAVKLGKLLARMRYQHEVEVIFVDDSGQDNIGSLLKTAFAEDPQVHVIAHDVHRGLGQALRTGFAHITGDIVITTDLDQRFNLNTIPQILAHLLVYDVDVVTASPHHPRGGFEGAPIYRRLVSPNMNSLYRLLVKWDIHSWTASFRAYRREVLDNISSVNNSDLGNTEMLVNAVHAGYSVSEYPVKVQFASFKSSNSSGLRHTSDHLRYLLKLPFSSKKRQHQSANLARRRT
jgi:dolichol-phosphate mannosyltransferase